MKAGKVARVALDAALSLMIVFEMLIQFTGEFLHEVVGFAFFATVVVHIAFSAAWVKKTARIARAGKLTARRTALAVVGCLLALAMVVLGVSSIAISGILSSAGFVWPIGTYSLWVAVHTFSAYAFCAIVIVHLAMHWAFLASAMKVSYDPSRRRAISAGVNAAAALGVLALGVTVAGKMAPQAASAEQGFLGLADADDAGGADASDADSTGGAVGTEGSSAGGSAGASGSGSANGSSREDNPSNDSSTGRSSSGKHGKPRSEGWGKSGKRHGMGSEASSDGYASDSANELSSGSESTSDTGGDSGALGICTLCRKQCQLSAPKCNKPYEAGLL